MRKNDGGSLSLGQLQVLTIARTMPADPVLMILDEATFSVDARPDILSVSLLTAPCNAI